MINAFNSTIPSVFGIRYMFKKELERTNNLYQHLYGNTSIMFKQIEEMKKIQNSFSPMLEQLKKTQEMAERFYKSTNVFGLSSAIADSLKRNSIFYEIVNKNNGFVSHLIAGAFDRAYQGIFSSLASHLETIDAEIKNEKLENVPTSEIDENVSLVLEQIEEISHTDNHEELLKNILSVLKDIFNKLNKPLLKKIYSIILHILLELSILFSFKMIEAHYIHDSFNKKQYKKISDAIKKASKKYRIVTAYQLHMRLKPKRNSKSIYLLDFGAPVRIVRKKKNWTFIEYKNDDIFISGWVFTRYIKPIK